MYIMKCFVSVAYRTMLLIKVVSISPYHEITCIVTYVTTTTLLWHISITVNILTVGFYTDFFFLFLFVHSQTYPCVEVT